jgi:hypothetical protein
MFFSQNFVSVHICLDVHQKKIPNLFKFLKNVFLAVGASTSMGQIWFSIVSLSYRVFLLYTLTRVWISRPVILIPLESVQIKVHRKLDPSIIIVDIRGCIVTRIVICIERDRFLEIWSPIKEVMRGWQGTHWDWTKIDSSLLYTKSTIRGSKIETPR